MAWRSLGDVMGEIVEEMDDDPRRPARLVRALEGRRRMTATGWQTVNRKSELAKFTEARAVDRKVRPAAARVDDRQVSMFDLAAPAQAPDNGDKATYSQLEICRYVDPFGLPLDAILKCHGFPVSGKLTLKEIEVRGDAGEEALSRIELDRPPLGEMATSPESMGRIAIQCGESVGAVYANVSNKAIPRAMAEAIRDESDRRTAESAGERPGLDSSPQSWYLLPP